MAVEEFLAQRMAGQLEHAPTRCQENLFGKLGLFMSGSSKDNWLMVITGYAGTGKTTAIAAFISVLKEFKYRYILLAPTGRSAKVLANYTGESAKTIHKQIYRQKSLKEGPGQFSLDINKNRNTVFIVDEASLLSTGGGAANSIFGSGDVLEDLVAYVRSNENNRLILMGDPAQLPPIGLERSPALDLSYLSRYAVPLSANLTTVVRQEGESGILHNATLLRRQIEKGDLENPGLETDGFEDIRRITGEELIEEIGNAMDRYGTDEVVVLCRSNNRANRYNLGIRRSILFREEQLTRGDKLMIVKNCYQFLEKVPELDFIANGDVARLERISKYEERYGLHFASASLSFPDYNNIEIDAKIILDTLVSDTPALSQEQQSELFRQVYEDYAHLTTKRKRMEAVREDIYFNALQVKYAGAITCHKSQGGQWKCVFIDNSLWKDPITLDDKKWLYTAITRGVEQGFLVNFKDAHFR